MKINVVESNLGTVFQEDCLQILPHIKRASVDLIFADPPFNLNKKYSSNINDNLSEEAYLLWCKEWIHECVPLLTDGAAFYIWTLPKWAVHLSGFLLAESLTFRNWIAVSMKYSMPIKGRLYPAHYALLYFIKGDKPRVFTPDRLPIKTCPHCFSEIHDYGGHKEKMNPNGVNMSDVWDDIYPVRHKKYKTRKENELPIKLLDRILEISTKEGDTVLDPFGGSGTTYVVAQLKERHWIGCELGELDTIKMRLDRLHMVYPDFYALRNEVNMRFTSTVRSMRIQKGMWV